MNNLTNYLSEGNIRNIERMFRNFMDTIKIHDGKIKPEEITVSSTPKGNWEVYRNGKKLCIVNGNLLNQEVIDKYELANHDIDEKNNQTYISAINEEKISIFDSTDNINGDKITSIDKSLVLKIENNLNNTIQKFIKKEFKIKDYIFSKFEINKIDSNSLIFSVNIYTSETTPDNYLYHLYKSQQLVSNNVPVTIADIKGEMVVSRYIIFNMNMKFKSVLTDSDDYQTFYVNPKYTNSNTIYYDIENNEWGYMK